MALIPFIIKIASLGLVFGFGLEENYLRQGLVLLPSYFAEGWLVARLIRMAVLGEYIEQRLSGDPRRDFDQFEDHIRAVLSSTIIYVLIKLCLALLTSLFADQMQHYEQMATPDPQEGNAATFLIALALLALILWAFRFLWLYIPAALGRSVEGFLKRISGIRGSFPLIATWLLCFVPLAVVLLLSLQMVGYVFGEGQETGYLYAVITLQAFIDLVTMIITSIALGFGIQSLYRTNP